MSYFSAAFTMKSKTLLTRAFSHSGFAANSRYQIFLKWISTESGARSIVWLNRKRCKRVTLITLLESPISDLFRRLYAARVHVIAHVPAWKFESRNLKKKIELIQLDALLSHCSKTDKNCVSSWIYCNYVNFTLLKAPTFYSVCVILDNCSTAEVYMAKQHQLLCQSGESVQIRQWDLNLHCV